MDGHTFCITVLEPSAFNYDYGFFGQNLTFPGWCRYVQSLPVALFWENKLECLIMKSLWAPRIFYLQVNYDGTIPPFKLISLPSRFSFAQPVQWPIFTWHQQSTIFSTNQYEKLMTVLLCDGLPCCHRKGAGFGSLKQDKRYV